MSEEKTERQEEMTFNEHGLNIKQDRFCELYVDIDREMFGNGFQSYVEAYDPDTSKPNWAKTVLACSSRLLTNAKVIARINGLLEKGGFTDENVSKQHLFLLNQHTDLKTKMKAIDSYYKLKGKNEEVEHTKILVLPSEAINK